MRISAFSSEELGAVLTRLQSLDKDVAKTIRTETKQVVAPLWKEAVLGNSQTRLEVRVLGDTATAAVSDRNVTLNAAGKGGKLRGGATPPLLAAGTEFGSSHYKQFGRRRRRGPVYTAVAQVVPRAASLWIQTVVKMTHNAFERGPK